MYELRHYIHKKDRIECHLLTADIIHKNDIMEPRLMVKHLDILVRIELAYHQRIRVMNEMARKGNLAAVKFLHKHKFPLLNMTFHYARQSKNEDLINWLFDQSCPFYHSDMGCLWPEEGESLDKACRYGIAPLRRAMALKINIDKTAHFANIAAFYGNVKDLEFLKKHDFPINDDIYSLAIVRKHYHVLEWGLKEKIIYDFVGLIATAEGSNLEMIKYIYEHFDQNFDGQIFSIERALTQCSVEVVMWALETGKITSADICLYSEKPDIIALVEEKDINYISMAKNAVGSLNFKFIRWFQSLDKINLAEFVTKYGYKPRLETIVEIKDVKLEMWMMRKAVGLGDLYFVEWLHTHGCPWPVNADIIAAQNNCIHILKYMHKIGKSFNREVLLKTKFHPVVISYLQKTI